MINRRNLITAIAAAPIAAAGFRVSAQEELRPLDVGDVQILGLSPDASTLVGTLDREVLVFLDTESQEILAQSDPMEEIKMIDETSIRWNPSGTNVAFSLRTWVLLVDSDIFVADAASGEITNLTSEGVGEVAASVMETEGLLIDLYPNWLDDETLVFSRHTMETIGGACEIHSIPLSGGETTRLHDLGKDGYRFVTQPIFVLEDGRLLTTADKPDNSNHLIEMSGDGEFRVIKTPYEGYVQLADVNEDSAIVVNAQASPMEIWLVPLDGEEPVRINEVFGLDRFEVAKSIPVFGADEGSILYIQGGDSTISILNDNGFNTLGNLAEGEAARRIFWEEDTVVICGTKGNWVLNSGG